MFRPPTTVSRRSFYIVEANVVISSITLLIVAAIWRQFEITLALGALGAMIIPVLLLSSANHATTYWTTNKQSEDDEREQRRARRKIVLALAADMSIKATTFTILIAEILPTTSNILTGSMMIASAMAIILFLHNEWWYFGKGRISAVEETMSRKTLTATRTRVDKALDLLRDLDLWENDGPKSQTS